MRLRCARAVVVLGLTGALVSGFPDGVSAVPARKVCRSTALVTNGGSGTVSTIDVKTMTKDAADIPGVGPAPVGVAFTPDGETALVTNFGGGTVSTIDVKTRTKNPADIPVGTAPVGVALTPCRR